ncbi:molecular chaperone [Escherichia sp. E4930]|uniref:fimbrial biogenesis chaperone n=1 Tax=unclassified Escherichia TaxID=2608889 RepID=UPI0010299071|nr:MULTISPECIES: molecular chaperone [unclassified Escherichia]RZM98343.1 molecular chaperone [Escherichia sp. E14V5]RZN02038.1 molecular chaperone [Escherichia sp. E14V7]RZN26426.1 molecular chaperone [Escherichia sp. E14V10]TGB53701.1 fimbrial protein [Escherichia sp. E5028]TGB68214.1 fimbrial protein [Escherichia sp. E4930]
MTIFKGMPLILLIVSLCSHAALQPDRTRIVFNANDKATSLRIENRSDKLPYLAYSWIENDKGDKSDDFLVALPPIQRLEAKATSQARIVKQSSTSQLPTDRESLFYYNLREIPPAPEKATGHAILQVAIQSRIKLFWRPAGLRKKSGEHVELQLQVSQQNNQLTLKNPTPYYLTIAYLGRDKKGILPGFKSTLIAPFASAIASTGNYNGNQFYLGYMDDYGALRMTTLNCQGQCKMQRVVEDKQ